MFESYLRANGLKAKLFFLFLSVSTLSSDASLSYGYVGSLLLLQQDASQSKSSGAALPPLWQPVDSANLRVTQTLLPLIHAAEVQTELGLSADQVKALEASLAEIDGPWWRARNLPIPEQRKVVADLEARLLQQLSIQLPDEIVRRIQQLELQLQTSRLLLRPDVAKFLELTPPQIAEIDSMISDTEKVSSEIEKLSQTNKDPAIFEKAQQRLTEARKIEIQDSQDTLKPAQRQKLTQVLGTLFDFSKCERIYPLAPELVSSAEWFGTNPGTLSELRGKVVVVHFYAFQCINCQRNFGRYNEWADQFKNEDVVLIGIQTPETSAESDPLQVRRAAEKDAMKFPVLIDLERKNWDAWGNTMWPTVYVIDKQGYIRMWWQGELNWEGAKTDQVVAAAIKKLLQEK